MALVTLKLHFSNMLLLFSNIARYVFNFFVFMYTY